MMKCVAMAVALAAALPAQLDPAALAERARSLVELALGEGQAYAILTDLTRTAPHRLSGSAGADRAVAWAVESMTRLSFENVRREEVMVPCWQRGDVAELAVVAPGKPVSLPVAALGGSVATPESGLIGEVLMVRSFEELRDLGAAAAGKIIFFNRPMPRILQNTFRAYGTAVPQRTSGAVEAAKAGGIAAIVRSMTTAIDDSPHTGAMHYQDGVERVPAAAVSTAGAERLANLLASGAPVRLRLRLSCRTLDDVPSANVIGEIIGSETPDEIVVVGAHLDAWDLGEGAHDDGAGCAHTLEALRLIKAAGLRPKRTIRAVLFINEENGLRGGRTYAADEAATLDHHVAAIETDAGGFEPKGFSTTAKGEMREMLRQWTEALRPYGMGALIPGGGGADISPMQSAGVVLFGLVVTSHRYFDYHHSERDKLAAVNERELALGAAAVAYLASVIADAGLPR